MKRWFWLAGVIAMIVLGACDSSSESSDLPVETKNYVTTDGYYQFYTNDTQNLNRSFGYIITNKEDPAAVFGSFTGVAKKVSGSPDYAYGFLFCYTETDAEVDDFYYVWISTHGNYKVGKKLGADWTSLQDWTSAGALKSGMNAENIVTVARTGSGNFAISFNGVSTYAFTDPSLTADGFAAIVFVGPAGEEDFPNNPVDVRFKFTSPAVLPSAVSAKMFQAASGNLSVSPGFAADIRP